MITCLSGLEGKPSFGLNAWAIGDEYTWSKKAYPIYSVKRWASDKERQAGPTRLKGDVFGSGVPTGNPVPRPVKALTKPSTRNAPQTATKVCQQMSLIGFCATHAPKSLIQPRMAHLATWSSLKLGNISDVCNTRQNQVNSIFPRKYAEGMCRTSRVVVLEKSRGRMEVYKRLKRMRWCKGWANVGPKR